MERTAEAIGEYIVAREQHEIQPALQLDLPMVRGEPITIMYVQMDATGGPVVKQETVNRPGKAEGQPAHTPAAKLGCVFTQTKWDEKGYAIRDPDSTTYVGAIETAEEFGKRIYLESLEAWLEPCGKESGSGGWSRMDLEPCRSTIFPGGIQIVDLYHARRHLWDPARKLYPNQEAEQRR